MDKQNVTQQEPVSQSKPNEGSESSAVSMKQLLIEEILHTPTREVMEILRIAGYSFPVPLDGCGFSRVDNFAKFYKVNYGYVGRVLKRHSVTEKDLPFHVIPGSELDERLKRHADAIYQSPSRYTVSKITGGYVVLDRADGLREVSNIKIVSSKLYYSPQVVLALPVLMYYGTHLDPESVGKKVLNLIERTTCYDNAATRLYQFKQNKPQAQAQPAQPQGECPSLDQLDGIAAGEGKMMFRQNGDVVLDGEVFWTIVKVMQGYARDIIESLKETKGDTGGEENY